MKPPTSVLVSTRLLVSAGGPAVSTSSVVTTNALTFIKSVKLDDDGEQSDKAILADGLQVSGVHPLRSSVSQSTIITVRPASARLIN
jgi:hypothetical protein